METLEALLTSIENCNACYLMSENKKLGIPYIPILPKPHAQVIFIGRDPSPRTAKMVGKHEGKSAFIKEVFRITNFAGLDEKYIYITDLCKCHWRTSVGKPIKNTEGRSTVLDKSVGNICMRKWLLREIEILQPRLIVSFGEELYQFLRPMVVYPDPAPEKFSATADKSVIDAEYWFASNGPLTVGFNHHKIPLAVLRHPGNSGRLRQINGDLRLKTHERATKQVQNLLEYVRGNLSCERR